MAKNRATHSLSLSWMNITSLSGLLRPSVGLWMLVLAFLALRFVSFSLGCYGTYTFLAQNYTRAELKLNSANNPINGKQQREVFAEVIAEAEALLSQSRLMRALVTEWNESYWCGKQSCYAMILGGIDFSGILIYLGIASGIALTIRSFFWGRSGQQAFPPGTYTMYNADSHTNTAAPPK